MLKAWSLPPDTQLSEEDIVGPKGSRIVEVTFCCCLPNNISGNKTQNCGTDEIGSDGTSRFNRFEEDSRKP